MLREPHERAGSFGRRDAIRLVAAAIPLLIALAAGVVGNLIPADPGYADNVVARSAIVAPRDASIPNPVETRAAKQAATVLLANAGVRVGTGAAVPKLQRSAKKH